MTGYDKAMLFNALASVDVSAEVMNIINNFPVEDWTRVKEQMPDNDCEVYVTVEDRSGYRFCIIDQVMANGEFINCDGREWKAIAWKPLPELYEGRP